ncbi:hypothetical protein GCM10027416_07230 [Okibacterium endophyticum]
MGLVHHAWRYREGVTTLPEYLNGNGYDTILVGLQHENVDPSVLGYQAVLSDGFLPRALPVADLAAEWLTRRDDASTTDPFLLTVGFWEAHRPWPEEDYEPVDPMRVEVPPYLPDTEGTRRDLAAFYGALRQLDTAFGRLLSAIDDTEAGREALVVFTTDHGAAFPRAKSTLYDPGVQVALIARPPRSWGREPARHAQLVSHLDILPTVLDLAGIPIPHELPGESLAGILRTTDESSSATRSLYFEKSYHDGYDPLRAVRTNRFKYIRSLEPSVSPTVPGDILSSETYRSSSHWERLVHAPEELYDLRADPDEFVNLIDSPAHDIVRAELSGALDEWMRATSDPVLSGPVAPPPPRTRSTDALPPLSDVTARAESNSTSSS